MEVASNHHRDTSLSSFGSFQSADIDSFLDDLDIAELPVGNERSVVHPRRKRLGAEMAIIACTSPEIKALNLPITPSFPATFSYHHRRSNSNGAFSSCSSASSTGSRKKNRLSPLLASTDDVVDFPTFPGPSDHQAMNIFLDETDELIRCFQNQDLNVSIDEQKLQASLSFPVDDKENMHPNLFDARSHHNRKKTLTACRGSNHRRAPKRVHKLTVKRPSLHRRASCDSLPSPAEIGQSPPAVRRATCGTFPFFPTEIDNKKATRRHRGDHQRKVRAVPRSMSLSAGFR